MNKIYLAKSLGEASLILLIANLPVLLTIAWLTFSAPGEGFAFEAIGLAFAQVYSLTGLFGYLAGLLASTVVFYWMNQWVFRVHTARALIFSFTPLFVLIFATPLFQVSRSGDIKNPDAAVSYAYVLLAISLILWIAALYHRRQIMDHEFDISGSEKSKVIREKLSDPRGDVL